MYLLLSEECRSQWDGPSDAQKQRRTLLMRMCDYLLAKQWTTGNWPTRGLLVLSYISVLLRKSHAACVRVCVCAFGNRRQWRQRQARAMVRII